MGKPYYTQETIIKKLVTMREICSLYKNELEDELKVNKVDGSTQDVYLEVKNLLTEIDPVIIEFYDELDALPQFVFDVLLNNVDLTENHGPKFVNKIIAMANRFDVIHEEITPDEFTEALPDYAYDEESVAKIVETFFIDNNEKVVLGYILVYHDGILIQVNAEGCCNVPAIDIHALNRLVNKA